MFGINSFKPPLTEIRDFIEKEKDTSFLYFLFYSPDNKGPELTFQALTSQCRMLYQGEARKDFGDKSPWLVKLDEDDTTLDYAINECFGKRMGVFLASSYSLDELSGHLRRFIKIKERDGDFLFFHFYDPQHLCEMITYFTLEQRKYFFEKITAIIAEQSGYKTMTIGSYYLLENGNMRMRLIVFKGTDTSDTEVGEMIIGLAEEEIGHRYNYDFNDAATRPYLILTSDQMEAPIVFNRGKLIGRLLEDLNDDYGEALSILPPAVLYGNFSVGIDHAMSYQIYHYRYILAFLEIMLSVAPGWHKEPTLNTILKRKDLSEDKKFSLIIEERYDKAWKSAAMLNSAEEWMSDDWQSDEWKKLSDELDEI